MARSSRPAALRRRPAPPPVSVVLHRRALDFVIEALAGVGLSAERLPTDVPADLLVAGPEGRPALLRLLAAAAPHRRGGRGSLGLHWMLTDTPAEFVALVDLSRRAGWLLPVDTFRSWAQPLPGGRFHLDWIVVPAPGARTRFPQEEEFAAYAFERVLPQLARQLPVDARRRPT